MSCVYGKYTHPYSSQLLPFPPYPHLIIHAHTHIIHTGCPYEGSIDTNRVVDVTKELLRLGCYEVSLGDTIGIATPAQVHDLLTLLRARGIPLSRIAVHFHDTGDKALANILVSLQHGIGVVDASVSGLGGCPYAEVCSDFLCG